MADPSPELCPEVIWRSDQFPIEAPRVVLEPPADFVVDHETFVAEGEEVVLDDGHHLTCPVPVSFAPDSITLSKQSKRTLRKMAAEILKRPCIVKVTITGHAAGAPVEDIDPELLSKYRFELSEKRAKIAKRFLVQQGVKSSIITPIGFGDKKRMNWTPDLRKENRRVEFDLKQTTAILDRKQSRIFTRGAHWFENDSNVLLDGGKQVLNAVAKLIRSNSDIKSVSVVGFSNANPLCDVCKQKSCCCGSNSAKPAPSRQAISESRAQSAVAYLTTRGVQGSLLTSLGHANKYSITTNDSIRDCYINRRIEFFLEFGESCGSCCGGGPDGGCCGGGPAGPDGCCKKLSCKDCCDCGGGCGTCCSSCGACCGSCGGSNGDNETDGGCCGSSNKQGCCSSSSCCGEGGCCSSCCGEGDGGNGSDDSGCCSSCCGNKSENGNSCCGTCCDDDIDDDNDGGCCGSCCGKCGGPKCSCCECDCDCCSCCECDCDCCSGCCTNKVSSAGRVVLALELNRSIKVGTSSAWLYSKKNDGNSWTDPNHDDSVWDHCLPLEEYRKGRGDKGKKLLVKAGANWIWSREAFDADDDEDDISEDSEEVIGDMPIYKVNDPTAILAIAADSEYDLHLNGVKVGTGADPKTARTHEGLLQPGKNTVAIEVIDPDQIARFFRFSFMIDGLFPGALIAKMTFSDRTLWTSPSWRVHMASDVAGSDWLY